MKLLQTERGGDITTDFWRAASAGDPLRRMGSPVALRPSPENAAAAVAIVRRGRVRRLARKFTFFKRSGS